MSPHIHPDDRKMRALDGDQTRLRLEVALGRVEQLEKAIGRLRYTDDEFEQERVIGELLELVPENLKASP